MLAWQSALGMGEYSHVLKVLPYMICSKITISSDILRRSFITDTKKLMFVKKSLIQSSDVVYVS